MDTKRLGLVVLAAISFACGGDGSKPTVARLEITPGTLLLDGAGDAVRVTARAFDAGGKEIAGIAPTWSSNRPEVVAVSPEGQATATAPLGSAQLVAKVGDVASAPAVVLVVRTRPDTLLVTDAQIASELTATAEDKSQYQVTLRDVEPPAAGTILVGREATPLVGRVVSAAPAGDGVVVTCDVIPPGEAFEELLLDERLPLPREAYQTMSRRTAGGAVPDGATPQASVEFDFGGMECEAEVQPKISLGLPIVLRLEPDIDLDYKLHVVDDELDVLRLVVTGTLAVVATGTIEVTAAFTAQFKCERELAKGVIPVGGPLAFWIAPTVPFGVGFLADGAWELAQMRAGLEGKLGGTIAAGFEYTRVGGMDGIADFTPIAELEPIFEYPSSLTEDWRFKVGVQPYAFVKLEGELLPTVPGLPLDVSLLEGTVGLRGELDYAPMSIQVEDANYASGYSLKFRSKLGFGETITDALKAMGGLLEISPPEIVEELPISGTPQGTFSSSKPNVPLGESVTFTVTLDPDTTTFLGVANVAAVELYRSEPVAGLTLFAAMTDQGGGVYTHEWTPTTDDEGSHELVAFVKPVILGLDLLPRLEIAGNASLDVVVHDPGSPPPSFAGLWRMLEGYGDCDTDNYPDEILAWPNGAASTDLTEELATCTAGDGTPYKVGRWAWNGFGDTLEFQLCEYDSAAPGEELLFTGTWNPVTERYEGVSHRGATIYNEVCLIKLQEVDFTGSCVAAACPRADTTCTNGYPGVALYCGCNPTICVDECGSGPPVWETSYTPTCF